LFGDAGLPTHEGTGKANFIVVDKRIAPKPLLSWPIFHGCASFAALAPQPDE
jgi:hypothetical protein